MLSSLRNRRTLFCAAIALRLTSSTDSAHGILEYSAHTWINPAGGSWSDSANWQDGHVPSSTYGLATFNLHSADGYTIVFPDTGGQFLPITVYTDRLSFVQPIWSIANLSYTILAPQPSDIADVTFSGGRFDVILWDDWRPTPGTATLNVMPATTVAIPGTYRRGGNTAINVNGPGASLLSDMFMSLPASSVILNVENGALAAGSGFGSSSNPRSGDAGFALGDASSALITVAGPGARLAYSRLTVASAASSKGDVDVLDGGAIDAEEVNVAERGAATLNVRGPASGVTTHQNFRAAFGLSSSASVTLSDRARLTARDLTLGTGSNSTASLSILSGSLLTTTGPVKIGHALSQAQSVFIGSQAPLTSRWSASTISAVKSTITVDAGGQLEVLGSSFGSGGLSLDTASSLIVYAGGTASLGSVNGKGSLTLLGGTLARLDYLSGTLAGHGTVNAGTLYTPGSFGVTISPDGTLAFNSNTSRLLATSSTRFLFDITSSSTYDRLTSLLEIQFNGILAVSLSPAYTPSHGDSFDLLDFSTRAGTSTFSSLNLPTLPPHLSWDTSALYTTGTVTVLPEPSSLARLFATFPFLSRRRRRI